MLLTVTFWPMPPAGFGRHSDRVLEPLPLHTLHDLLPTAGLPLDRFARLGRPDLYGGRGQGKSHCGGYIVHPFVPPAELVASLGIPAQLTGSSRTIAVVPPPRSSSAT
jgi:hypothetical protein